MDQHLEVADVSDDDGGGGGRPPLYLSRRQIAALRRQRLEHWKVSLWHSRCPLGAFSVAAGGQQGRRHRELQRYDIGSFTDCVGKSSKPPLLVDARSSSRSILSLFYINPAVFCRSVPVAPARACRLDLRSLPACRGCADRWRPLSCCARARRNAAACGRHHVARETIGCPVQCGWNVPRVAWLGRAAARCDECRLSLVG